MRSVRFLPKRRSELTDLQAYIFLCAPDNWPHFDDLQPEGQWSLKMAVEMFHDGIDFVFKSPKYEDARAEMHQKVDEMYRDFQSGDVMEGRERSIELADLVRGAGKRPRP